MPTHSATPPSRHVLISGTGRAGTTLLVQFFSALGLDTGFSADEAIQQTDPYSNAGLENWLKDERRPYIIKNPRFADEIDDALDSGRVIVDAAIIPMRDLYSAAESRRVVFRDAQGRGAEPLAQPGTLWKTSKPHKQEFHLAVQFYNLLRPLVRHEVPIYFLDFPRFAKEPDYLIGALGPFLEQQRVSEEDGRRAFQRVVKPELINEFQKTKDQSPRTRGRWARFWRSDHNETESPGEGPTS